MYDPPVPATLRLLLPTDLEEESIGGRHSYPEIQSQTRPPSPSLSVSASEAHNIRAITHNV